MPTSFQSTAYTNHPIQIPPDFPKILKQYTKAAIRTQPKDLLLWSVSYFRCLANSEIPPVKERLEYPVPPSESGLTPGLLRVLNKQLGLNEAVQKSALQPKWRGICLSLHYLEELLHSGQLDSNDNIPWLPFMVEAAVSIAGPPGGPVTVEAVMTVLCEALCDHPEGAASNMPIAEFVRAFRSVTARLNIREEDIDAVEKYLFEVGKRQDGILMPQNFKASECPEMEEGGNK